LGCISSAPGIGIPARTGIQYDTVGTTIPHCIRKKDVLCPSRKNKKQKKKCQKVFDHGSLSDCYHRETRIQKGTGGGITHKDHQNFNEAQQSLYFVFHHSGQNSSKFFVNILKSRHKVMFFEFDLSKNQHSIKKFRMALKLSIN
jgi:hypothetical protein